MALAPNTGSTLTLPDGTNKTSTSISTNIIITVNGVAVGAVQTLSIDEARTITMVDEVGTDGHVDSTPTRSTNITGSCDRIRFDRLRITEAFSRGFIHAHAQVYPFDIVIIDRQKQDVNSQISTVIKNVWINRLSTAYRANDWIVTDTMGWEAETIYSFLTGSGAPVAQGGELGLKHAFIAGVEENTDRGANGRRGSMDASGIIDLATFGDLF